MLKSTSQQNLTLLQPDAKHVRSICLLWLKHKIQIRPLLLNSTPPEVSYHVLILLVPTQQAMQEYYICFNDEVDHLGIWPLPVQQKAGQLRSALHLQPLLQCSKPIWHSLSFWNELYLLAISPHKGRMSFSSPLHLHVQFSLVWTASSCYVLSTLNLTHALSSAGGNSPTPHPETSQLNQNIQIQAEGGALQTVTITHV